MSIHKYTEGTFYGRASYYLNIYIHYDHEEPLMEGILALRALGKSRHIRYLLKDTTMNATITSKLFFILFFLPDGDIFERRIRIT